MIRVTPSISIAERELEEHFIRASGPGGQNVNKLASAVQLRFDVRRSPSLPDDVRARAATGLKETPRHNQRLAAGQTGVRLAFFSFVATRWRSTSFRMTS